tara:strand:+ start:299 stop:583 length:285 start_codon:yes stop_codon:yes gene_type:complete
MVKKKSKYRHISIAKKRYYYYKIKWQDILGDSGHANTKEFDAMRPAIKITYGFIYKKDRKYLWTFNTYDEKDDEFTDRNVFPMGCVLGIQKIEI